MKKYWNMDNEYKNFTLYTPLTLILSQFAVFHCLSDSIIQLLL